MIECDRYERKHKKEKVLERQVSTKDSDTIRLRVKSIHLTSCLNLRIDMKSKEVLGPTDCELEAALGDAKDSGTIESCNNRMDWVLEIRSSALVCAALGDLAVVL
jgi:hypothetical protein